MKRNRLWIFLILILVIGAVFRFLYLDSIPPGLYPDEAINANNGLEAADTGNFETFFPDNNGREGFYINLLGILLNLFGAKIWVIRLLPALIGLLTVFAVWFLTKELFNNERLALWAAFFIATSFWHVNFSRIGFRGILVPLLITLSFAFLWRGLKTIKTYNFILAGIFFGLGFHTYIAFRFAPLLLVITLLAWWWDNRKTSTGFGCEACYKVLLFLFVAFIVALPIGIYFLQNPQDFLGRATGVSIFAAENPLKELLESTVKTLSQFNIIGDYNWRHNLSGRPQLLLPVGLLFLFGLLLSLKRLKTYFKNSQDHQLSAYIFILTGLLIFMLPSILTAEGLPHALRSIGTIPFAIILAALGFERIFSWLLSLHPKRNLSLFSIKLLAFIILAAIATLEFNKYFIVWAQDNEVKGAFTQYFVQIGEELKSQPENVKKYVIVNESGTLVDGLPMPAQTVMFTSLGTPNITYLLPEEIEKINLRPDDFIIPMRFDEEIFNQIKQQTGELTVNISKNGVYILTK